MKLSLRFRHLPAELLEVVLADLASAVLGRPVTLAKFQGGSFDQDRRERELSAEGVVVTELTTRTWEPGRDGGWGYGVEWTLELSGPGGPVSVGFSAAGWEPIPNDLSPTCEGLDAAGFRRVRARLRERLGDEADQSDDAWPALANIEAALEAGENELARELFEGASAWPGPRNDLLLARIEALRDRVYGEGDKPG